MQRKWINWIRSDIGRALKIYTYVDYIGSHIDACTEKTIFTLKIEEKKNLGDGCPFVLCDTPLAPAVADKTARCSGPKASFEYAGDSAAAVHV